MQGNNHGQRFYLPGLLFLVAIAGCSQFSGTDSEYPL